MISLKKLKGIEIEFSNPHFPVYNAHTKKRYATQRRARNFVYTHTERERGKNLTGEKSCGLRAKVFLFSSLRKIRAIGIFLFRERDINKQSSTTRARGSLFLSAVVRKERERES